MQENTTSDMRKHLIFQVHTPNMLREVYETRLFNSIHYNGEAADVLEIVNLFKECNVHTCSISDEEISVNIQALMQLIHLGIHVIAYTVNHRRRINKLKYLGIDGVFTDFLAPDELMIFLIPQLCWGERNKQKRRG